MIANEGDVGDDEEFRIRSPGCVLVNHPTNALNLLLADAYDYLLGTTCREVLSRGHYAIALIMNGKHGGALALSFLVKPPDIKPITPTKSATITTQINTDLVVTSPII